MLLCNFTKRNFSEKIRKSLEQLGLKPHIIYHNLSTSELYEKAILHNNPVDRTVSPYVLTSTGALATYSGLKTGRSPADKRIVKDESTQNDIWWGKVNTPISNNSYKMLESRALDYLSSRPRLYVADGYAGWDPKYRIKVRIIACRSYHAMFMRNMLIVPTKEQLEQDFNGASEPDYHIFNSGELNAGQLYEGVNSRTSVALNFSERKMVILGTQYAGEMKKGVFTIMHYLMPKRGILSMHASANEGEKGDVTLLFGLSGTGKTTLSADVNRKLIGDDEHCWSDDGIFNIEGGCYAKCVGLNQEKEPEIFNAIKYGSLLENVKFKEGTREVDYNDISITENTRVCYPLDYIPGAKIPAIGGHPKNIFFLTCDAYGVLPPVSKLTYEQAMYHFISGYTAKVAGTEVGVKEPTSTFSACFGEAFLPLHPTVYAELLAKKMKQHNTNAWLINTGWSGGKYGVGKRMDLTVTRRIIDNIHSGELANFKTTKMPIFGLEIPESCTGVEKRILNPIDTWQNKDEYNRVMMNLASEFKKNFSKYEDKASQEILNAAPRI